MRRLAARDEEILGWQRLEEGRLEEAEGHFRRSLELDPDRIDALNGLGMVYLRWDDLDEAAELFQMAIAMAEPLLPRRKRRTGWQDPAVRPYIRALMALAVTRVRRGAYDEAVAPLETAIAWDPGGAEGEAFLWLGQCHHRLGDLARAREAYGWARAKRPEAWFLHGLVADLMGDAAEARRSFRTGADLFPELTPLLAYYPRVRGFPGGPGHGRYAQAVAFVEETIDLWTASAQRHLLEAVYPDAVAGL